MIYKLMLNRMPDENTNPVGTTQTSLNDQAMNNQIGDDFVLDFGEGTGNGQVEIPEVEQNSSEGVEQGTSEDMVKTDIDLDSEDLFAEDKEEQKEEDMNITLEDNSAGEKSGGESVFDSNVDFDSEGLFEEEKEEEKIEDNNEMDVQLTGDTNEEKEESEEVAETNIGLDDGEKLEEEKEEEKIEDNNEMDIQLTGDTSEEKEESEEVAETNIGLDDGEKLEEEKEKIEDNNEMDIQLTGDTSEEKEQIEEVAETNIGLDDGEKGENEPLKGDDIAGSSDDLSDVLDLESENNINVSENILDGILDSNEEKQSDSNEEGKLNIVDETDFESEQGLVDGKDDSLGDEELGHVEEKNLGSELEGNLEGSDKSMVMEDDSGTIEDVSDKAESADADNSEDKMDSIESENSLEGGDEMDGSSENATVNDEIQNEKGEDNISVELNGVGLEQVSESSETEESDNTIENSDKEVEISGIADERDGDNTEISSQSDNQDDIGMSFDLQFDSPSNSLETGEVHDDVVSNDNGYNAESQVIDENNNEEGNGGEMNDNLNIENDTYEGDNNMVDNSNPETEEKDQEGFEIKSTLSLDEIMDTELQSGKFSDDDQNLSVETNKVEDKKDGKGKRIFIVAAGVCVFLMMGAVAYLALPNLFNNQPGSIVDTIEGDQHSIPLNPDVLTENNPTEVDENIPGETEIGDSLQYENPTEGGSLDDSPKVGVEFPNPTGGDDILGDSSSVEMDDLRGDDTVTPYVWEGEVFDSSEGQEPKNDELILDEINNKIISFREQGELYYTVAQESSDMHIYKHALKILALCDDYEEQISNGEGMDEESYESFNKMANGILSKIYEYVGESEVKTIKAGNDGSDERTEEENEKYRKYVTDRADSQ